MFSTGKNVRLQCFIFGPKHVLENATMLKIGSFSHFQGPWNYLEVLKNNQIFSTCSVPSIFSTDKNMTWFYILHSKNLLKHVKMSKSTVCLLFLSILESVEVIWGNIKNHELFSSCSTPCMFSRKKVVIIHV